MEVMGINRLEVLDRMNWIFTNKCNNCKDSVYKGKSHRDTHTCKTCEFGIELREIGDLLTQDVKESRELRKEHREKVEKKERELKIKQLQQFKKQEEEKMLTIEKLRELKDKGMNDSEIVKKYKMNRTKYYELKEKAGLKGKHAKSPIKVAVEKVNAGETLQQQISKLKELLENKDNEMEELKINNESLKRYLDESKEAYELEIEKLKTTTINLQKELENSDDLITKLTNESKKKDVLALEQEITLLKDEITLNEKALSELHQSIKLKDYGIERMQEYNRELLDDNDLLKVKIKRLESTLQMYLGDGNV